MAPTVRSGLGSESAPVVMSPLQPNQMPPFCLSASMTPAASPPAVGSPSLIGATRLDTTTRRDTVTAPHQPAAAPDGASGGDGDAIHALIAQQFAVRARPPGQLTGRAVVDDVALIHHDNAVEAAQRGQPVSNGDHRAPVHQAVECGLDGQ